MLDEEGSVKEGFRPSSMEPPRGLIPTRLKAGLRRDGFRMSGLRIGGFAIAPVGKPSARNFIFGMVYFVMELGSWPASTVSSATNRLSC